MWTIIYDLKGFCFTEFGACHEAQLYFDLNIFCFRYSELTEVQQQLIRETLITWLQAQVRMSLEQPYVLGF